MADFRSLRVELPAMPDSITLDQLLAVDYPDDLQEQYRSDVLAFAYYSLMYKAALAAQRDAEDAFKDCEVDLEAEYRQHATVTGQRTSEAKLRHSYYADARYKAARAALREVERHVDTLASIVDALNKKHIGLTMMASRAKAELAAGLRS